MSEPIKPARLVRITGINDDLYALDEAGKLWSFERDGYSMVWVALPRRDGLIVDMYVHVKVDTETPPWTVVDHALRILVHDRSGSRVFELRRCAGEYLWDEISLEPR
jgi:hypothetical protein